MRIIYKKLFSHQTCSKLRYTSRSPWTPCIRYLSTSAPLCKPKKKEVQKIDENDPANRDINWQPRNLLAVPDKQKDFDRYELVTAFDLRTRQMRPRRVKMLMRDFIEGKITDDKLGNELIS
jgi:hypothetical protein